MVRATWGLALTVATTGRPSTSATSAAVSERCASATMTTPSNPATPAPSTLARAT